MHSFARNVTRPRSPGPPPTRKHLPMRSFVLLLLLSIDLLQQLRCEMLSVVMCASHFTLAWQRGSVFEDLRVQFHFSVLHFRQNSNRRLAITLQQPQKFALCSQAKQRVAIVDWIDNLSRSFIIPANLERNDSLPSRRQKNFARKNRHEKFAALEVDFVSRQRKTQPLQPSPGKHDRIPIILGELAQTRRDVPAEIDSLYPRVLPVDLMFSSHAARRHYRPLRKRREAARLLCNQHVIH